MTKSIPTASDRAWLEVDLAAIVRNARRFRQLIGSPLLPMVKANAYGLGAVPVAQALERVDPWGYGVATVEEGRELRAAGLERPIVSFTPMLPSEVEAFQAARLRPVIGDFAALAAWLAGGGGPFHVEIDTGMSRSGFSWRDAEAIRTLAQSLSVTPGWEGIFTHFHSADSNPTATQEQAARFDQVVRELGCRPPLLHLSGSGGAQRGQEYGRDLARPGIFLYGGRVGSLQPEPAVRLCARVVAQRRLRAGDTVSYRPQSPLAGSSTIATLAIGYGDGVPRALSGRGRVEVGDAVVPIAGRVTMDMIMVDMGDRPVAVGDTAVIFGGQVSLEEQAELAGTIPYELLTMVMPRVVRRYRESA